MCGTIGRRVGHRGPDVRPSERDPDPGAVPHGDDELEAESAEVESSSRGRPSTFPRELDRLLDAKDGEAREAAWARLLDSHSRLILHTVHARSDGHDAAMDRYAFVLQKLREDDFRRLRRFAGDGRGQFTTWLVVVTRRLCEDYRRHRYGRPQSRTHDGEQKARLRFQLRRMLVDMDVAEARWSRLPDPTMSSPDLTLREAELRRLLAGALEELEPRDRLMLRLRFEYDLPAKRIAHLMGFATPFHVYRRLRSRLGRLRKTLEQRGVYDARP